MEKRITKKLNAAAKAPVVRKTVIIIKVTTMKERPPLHWKEAKAKGLEDKTAPSQASRVWKRA